MREYVTQMAEEMTARVNHQRETMLKLIEVQEQNGGPIPYCPLVDCSPRRNYRAALTEAVRVLEETRRSFKSKQLEELRKKLQAMLAEDADRSL